MPIPVHNRCRSRPWLLVGLALLSGCAADGTDYEALPFYREDRTLPNVVQADIPILLTTIDTYPPQSEQPLSRDPVPVGRRDPVARFAVDPQAKPSTPQAKRPTSRPRQRVDVMPATQEREPRPDPKLERDYFVRLFWPIGRFAKQGGRVNWFVQGILPTEGGLGQPGPMGRAVSSDEAVRKDLFQNFSPDAEPGGLNTLPLLFSLTEIDHQDYPDREGRSEFDKDVSLWPFFAYGTGDSEEDDYFAIMPFGGTTRGLMGKEKITWFGFPYPIYMKIKDRSYDSHHVLWPFINWVDGPRNSGFRVLPFYGHYERKGRKGNPIYERTFLLWPFLSWSTSGMNEEEPTNVFFAFPFYGQIWGPTIRSYTVLWPFFKYEERKLGPNRSLWELRAPFPFFQIASDGQDYFKLDLFPLFGFKQRRGFRRHFALWPIWRAEDLEGKDKSFTGRWLLPLFWYTHWERKKTQETETKFRVFPLFHYRSYRDGSLDVGGISPFWFDSEGWDRTLGHFLRLYRYQRDKHGGTEHQALLGLFSIRDLPELAPGEAYKGAPERAAYSRLSLLFGMIQMRAKGGEKGLRLLWLLPEITWGEVDG